MFHRLTQSLTGQRRRPDDTGRCCSAPKQFTTNISRTTVSRYTAYRLHFSTGLSKCIRCAKQKLTIIH